MERATSLRIVIALVITALVAGLTLVLLPGEGDAKVTKLTARLRGSEATDENGRGRAIVKMDPRERTVCFNLSWNRIGQPFAAHIHDGGPGEDGPIVVPFFNAPTPEDALPEPISAVRGCVTDVQRSLIRGILRNPGDFYVNVHNADFPPGAIRGQLRK
ncbi:MAG: CHRD domain-containing protein [Actinomycetota bacterium]